MLNNPELVTGYGLSVMGYGLVVIGYGLVGVIQSNTFGLTS